MTSLRFRLPCGEDGDQDVVVEADFDHEELVRLRKFAALMKRVRHTSLLSRGMGGFHGIRWNASEVSVKASVCTDGELHELLHVLRPVTLQDEDTSFDKVRSILGRRIDSPEVRAFLKLNGRVFRHGEMSLYMQLSIEDLPLFDEKLLNIWLYGTQYHTDTEKADAWIELESILDEQNSRALVVSQLHSKVLALLNIDYIVRVVVNCVGNCGSLDGRET